MTAQPVYSRLEQIERALLQSGNVPLFGATPDFPWDIFSSQLSHSLQVEGLKVNESSSEWRTAHTIIDGMAGDITAIHIAFAPLPGTVCWLMNDASFSLLMTELLFKEGAKKVFDGHHAFKKAFQRFLALEILNIFTVIKFAEGFAPELSSDGAIPQEDVYCIDVVIALGKQKASGRIALTRPFQEAWKKYFVPKKPTSLSEEISRSMDVSIAIEAGKTSISLGEWESATVGDVILLDSCSLSAAEGRDTVTLTFGETPFFRGKVTPKGIEIMDVPVFSETVIGSDSGTRERM